MNSINGLSFIVVKVSLNMSSTSSFNTFLASQANNNTYIHVKIDSNNVFYSINVFKVKVGCKLSSFTH